jgi:hypothetical protein
MAIDTRDKRGSVINFDASARNVLPNPNGTIDQGDRQQLARKYRGISALVVSNAVRAIISYRRRRV